MTRMTEV